MKQLFTEEQQQEIISDYHKPDATMLSVGVKWLCGESTVRDILKRHNVKSKPKKRGACMSRDTRMFRDYLSGATVGFLAGKYQLSPQRVCVILDNAKPDRRKLSGIGGRYDKTDYIA